MTQEAQLDPKAVATHEPLTLRGIPPALLNSADIAAYAEQLSPRLFEPFNKDGLKTATYEIPFEGDVYRWRDESSSLEKHILTKDGVFTIDANSIVYVSPETYFRVPHFLALRFNLHIKLVHRGLLLGTGPLVDPGFAGRLLIPVHNLTSQPLVVRGGDGFLWVEVTKISPVRFGSSQVPFAGSKKARTAEDYLKAANSFNPIVSTLHVTSARLAALWQRMRLVSYAGGFTVAVAMAALTYSVVSLVRDAHQYVTDTRKASSEDMEKLQVKHGALLAEKASVDDVKKLEKIVEDQQAEIERLKKALVPSTRRRSERPILY